MVGTIEIERVGVGYLPEMRHITPGWRGGRNPLEGYQRGCGLRQEEPGGLFHRVHNDPEFIEARSCLQPPGEPGSTVVWLPRLMNLFLLFKFTLPLLPKGDVVEYGCYKGGSALFMAKLAQRFLPGAHVYGFDTFEGMPETDSNIDAHRAGDFKDNDLSKIEAVRDRLGLTNLTFVKGLVQDTADKTLAGKKIALAHIDLDIYSGCAFSYDVSRLRMVPKGVFVFDDATEPSCIGATQVVEELVVRRDGLNSEQIWPHFVYRAR